MRTPTPVLTENRESNNHGRQLQIYTVYRSAHAGGWNVKDRWGHTSDWSGLEGLETKEEALEKAKERARNDRPAMVIDKSSGKTYKYPLRKKDIPEKAKGDEITEEQRKEMRKDLMEETEYSKEDNSVYKRS